MIDTFVTWLSYWATKPLPPSTPYGALIIIMLICFIFGMTMGSNRVRGGVGRAYQLIKVGRARIK